MADLKIDTSEPMTRRGLLNLARLTYGIAHLDWDDKIRTKAAQVYASPETAIPGNDPEARQNFEQFAADNVASALDALRAAAPAEFPEEDTLSEATIEQLIKLLTEHTKGVGLCAAVSANAKTRNFYGLNQLFVLVDMMLYYNSVVRPESTKE